MLQLWRGVVVLAAHLPPLLLTLLITLNASFDFWGHDQPLSAPCYSASAKQSQPHCAHEQLGQGRPSSAPGAWRARPGVAGTGTRIISTPNPYTKDLISIYGTVVGLHSNQGRGVTQPAESLERYIKMLCNPR